MANPPEQEMQNMPQLMVGFPALINHSESEERLLKQLAGERRITC